MYRVFSLDVTTATFVSQNNETAAMLQSQTNPVGVELFSYANAFFSSNKFAYMLATWVKTLDLYQKLKFKAVIEKNMDSDLDMKRRATDNSVGNWQAGSEISWETLWKYILC